MKGGVSIQEHNDTLNKIIINIDIVKNVKVVDKDKAFFLVKFGAKVL